MIHDDKTVARFWAKVDRRGPKECWEWTSFLDKWGYGRFGIRPRGTSRFAHRICWEIVRGELPDDLCVLHDCDNAACVNPRHLFLGTDGDNARDKARKGRLPRGEQARSAKLTRSDVLRIRELSGTGPTRQEIADTYGVHYSTVSQIVYRKKWAWLP